MTNQPPIPLPPRAETSGGFDAADGQRLITARFPVDGLPAEAWVALCAYQYGDGHLVPGSADIGLAQEIVTVPQASALVASILAAVELSEQWATWSATIACRGTVG